MAILLTQNEIRALYGIYSGDVIAFGRSVSNKMANPQRKRRKFTADDIGDPAAEAYWERLRKYTPKTEAPVITADVAEQIF